MPYYREALLSVWPLHMVFNVGAPPAKLDPALLASLKRAEIGGYAPNPRKTRRYQIEDTRVTQNAHGSLSAPKFLSEKARRASSEEEPQRRMSDILDALNDLAFDDNSKRDIPVMYRNVEIKYSKFGVDDFDFESVKSFDCLRNQLTDFIGTLIKQNSRGWKHTLRILMPTLCYKCLDLYP